MTDQRSTTPNTNTSLPAARLELPNLDPHEQQRIRQSITRHGVLDPIIVSAGPALLGMIADGRLRDQLARQLNIDCPRSERSFASELEFHLYRYTVNVDRRQLTHVERIRLGLQLEPFEAEQAARRRAQAAGKRQGEKSLPVALPEQTGETRQRVAHAVGLKPSSYERGAKVLKEGSPELIQAFESGRETINSAYNRLRSEQRRQQKLALAQQLRDKPPPLPDGRFQVVVIDRPWPYDNDNLPYPTMTLQQIAALPLRDLLTDDGFVWLWTTNAFHDDAKKIASQDWQLRYENTLTWGKDKAGTGHRLRGQTEHCLLYARGNPLFIQGAESTLLLAPAREHSRKPDAFYTLVEHTCPGTKLELFARQRRPDWTSWGAETNHYPPLETAEDEEAA
jgi:N6-adenosine-specific RNA methylase IME4